MKAFFNKYRRLIFYAGWLLAGLLQAVYTELQDDEAYYWVFSRYLDWGYFDHPPLIALLIKMGTVLLPGEAGVRLVPLLLSTATIYVCEKLTAQKSPFLFYAVVLSVAVLQISGFVAVPDVPLMFFTALFFLVYQRYLQRASWLNALALGIIAALLLYSKYHGVLILFFVLLSNFKLLRDVKIYAAGFVALLLFVPHLYWQYQHNWISFRYHLFESNVNPYRISHTTDYILGQLLLAGPFAGAILWPAAFVYKAKNNTERALQFTAVGFGLFFLLSTLKGKVEPNWTSPAIVALLVLGHQALLQKQGWRKWLYRQLPLTILLVLIFRVAMIVNIIPAQAVVERYHGWQGWPQTLAKKTNSYPVVFNSSYQLASKYWFYGGAETYSLNRFNARRNNYNFWPIEDSLLGRPVYVMDLSGLERFPDTIKTPLYTIGYRFDSSYHSFSKISFSSNGYSIHTGDSLRLQFTVTIPAHYQSYLQQHPEVSPKIAVGFFTSQTMVKFIELPFNLQDVLQKNIRSARVLPGLEKGNYFMRFGIMSDSDVYTHNSDKIKLNVE